MHGQQNVINTQFIVNKFFLSPTNLAFHEIVWKNIVERGRPQMEIRRVRFACWVTKATNTHSGYVMHIAVPLQVVARRRDIIT